MSGERPRKTHCPKGHELTPENTAIRPRKGQRDVWQCRICHREHGKQSRKKLRPARKEWYYRILMESSCVDCGETHPMVLCFDHINPEDKLFSVANGVHDNFSKKRVLEEMAKCEVRCANCHAKRTAVQFDWYRYMPDEFRSSLLSK